MLYHELVLKAAKAKNLELPLVDSKDVRANLTDMFRQAQWICRFTFKGDGYQQSLELECRDIRPGLRLQPTVEMMMPSDRTFNLPHCRLNNGCPVVQLSKVMVDAHLGKSSSSMMKPTEVIFWILSMIDHHNVFRQICLVCDDFLQSPLAQTNPEDDSDDFIRFLQITKQNLKLRPVFDPLSLDFGDLNLHGILIMLKRTRWTQKNSYK